MEKLANVDGLVIGQQKEWTEIFTGFETKNRYVVRDTAGNELYAAAEVGGSWLGRQFLKSLRPFTVSVRGLDGAEVLSVKRRFRFYFHKVEVYDGNGELLGTIQKRWSLLRRIYSVYAPDGIEAFQLFGPVLHPWTFEIHQGAENLGKITKKWSGLGTEMFTKADNFGVMFPSDWDIRTKALFLGAVFLIDFVHFESSGG